ncbi:MAG TPA: hypothetical protein VN776_05065, partial [Terracidiphilus sp.]|nr:hypothetical protein [Terracidiphilus sp.]
MLKNARHASVAVLLRRALAIVPLLISAMLMFAGPERVPGQQASKIELKTTSFEPGGFIPKRFTWEAADVSPALSWGDPPTGTQS